VGMSPATPAVGYRFLIDAAADGAEIQREMLRAIDAFCVDMGLSGAHLLFVDPVWRQSLGDSGFAAWHHQSFLWQNPGCAVFDDYLRPFKSSQRRNIHRERRQMERSGIRLQALAGEAIDPAWAGRMYDYYLNTNAQYGPWAARYLNESFFKGIFNHYRHRLLLIAACQKEDPDPPVALSLLLRKGDQLIGRYWGCADTIKDLHFNMCFYEPIQWAIDHHIRTFDPGAGSPHKLYRGFAAVANTSLHRFYEPHLKMLFQRFIDGINQVEQANIDALNAQLPFAQESP
ncbi:MAG: GNAT family N-acetyltransferase, partial [Desulfatitalea sp.]